MRVHLTTVKHLLLALVISVGLFSLLPATVEGAGLITCGRTNGTVEEKKPCTICHVVVAGNNVMKWGLGIMTVIAFTVVFAMAVLYVVSAGNPGLMQTAKGGIVAALIGFAVMLSAWLIVNTILTILVRTDTGTPFAGVIQTGVFKFSCDQASNANYTP